jgi:hypothetical protein
MSENDKPGFGKKLAPDFAGGTTGEARALKKLLLQDGSGSVLAGILGGNDRGMEIAQAEARLLHSRGAVVIDCEDMNADDLMFGIEIHPDGFKNGRGPLAMALDAGQPVILANFAKIKPGGTGILHPLFQFLSGEREDLSLLSPDGTGEPYKISRGDLGPNFRLRVTGIQGDGPVPSTSLNTRITFVSPDETIISPSSVTGPSPKK